MKIARAESLISHLLIEVNKLLIRTVDNRSEKRVNSKNRHEFILNEEIKWIFINLLAYLY